MSCSSAHTGGSPTHREGTREIHLMTSLDIPYMPCHSLAHSWHNCSGTHLSLCWHLTNMCDLAPIKFLYMSSACWLHLPWQGWLRSWAWDILRNVWFIAFPNQTVYFWHLLEDILGPRPQINLPIAASESCCKARSFEYNKPYIFENSFFCSRWGKWRSESGSWKLKVIFWFMRTTSYNNIFVFLLLGGNYGWGICDY